MLLPAPALLGGTAMYLVAHVVFPLRNVHCFSAERLVSAVVLVALIPSRSRSRRSPRSRSRRAAAALIVYESIRFAELRDRLRHQVTQEHAPA